MHVLLMHFKTAISLRDVTCFRANGKHHPDERHAISDNEWKVFLQGNVMANMISEEQREKYSGQYTNTYKHMFPV